MIDHRHLDELAKSLAAGGLWPIGVKMDEWQLVMFAKVAQQCRVKVVTDGLPAETLRKCRVEPAVSVETAVAECLAEYGPQARVAVIPKGPYVLPYVAPR